MMLTLGMSSKPLERTVDTQKGKKMTPKEAWEETLRQNPNDPEVQWIAGRIAGSINELSSEILSINMANGWNVTKPTDWHDTEYKIPAILALIHSEVSEALEAFRNNDIDNFAEELADVLIRVLDCAAGLNIDMELQVRSKMNKNKLRGHRHGGKRV